MKIIEAAIQKILPPASQSGKQYHTPILTRFLITFIPIALFLTAGALILYSVEKNALHTIVKNQESNSLVKQQNLIKSDFQAIISDLLYLANQAGNHATFKNRQFIWGPDLFSEFLEFTRYKGIYDQVRLLDSKGMEKIRINYNAGRPTVVPTNRLQNKGQRYYFTDTIDLGRGEVFVSPFDLNIEKGRIEEPLKPMIRFGTPVLDKQGVKLGVIILNYLGSQINTKLRNITNAVPSNNMLLNTDGYWIISPTREDEWGFMYPDRKNRTYSNRHPKVWNQIANQKSGQLYDAGDLYTFSAIYPLKEDVKSSTGSSEAYTPSARPIAAANYYWILLSQVPDEYFMTTLNLFLTKLFVMSTLLLVLFAMGSWIVAGARANRDQLMVEKQLLIEELEAHVANIRTLSGLIPICASCKNIRDDKGYWNRIESYIVERSEAKFSHSICPVCSKKLYPDLYPGDE